MSKTKLDPFMAALAKQTADAFREEQRALREHVARDKREPDTDDMEAVRR